MDPAIKMITFGCGDGNYDTVGSKQWEHREWVSYHQTRKKRDFLEELTFEMRPTMAQVLCNTLFLIPFTIFYQADTNMIPNLQPRKLKLRELPEATSWQVGDQSAGLHRVSGVSALSRTVVRRQAA